MLNRIPAVALVTLIVTASARVAVAQTPPVDPAAAFFDDTVVHDVNMSINPRDWTSLREHFDQNVYYPSDLRWRDQVLRYVGIRSRGTGSRSPLKPGLRVDFDRYVTGQKFVGLKSFILRNHTQDASNLHERLSMLMFRRLGLAAEREAHARLYVNNEYVGLYTIVESLDKDFLQKNFGENDGHLYEFHFDNGAIAAGSKAFVFQYLGPDPGSYVPVPFQPQTHEDDPQGEVIARFIQTVNDTNAAGWRTAMAEYFDLAKFIRHLAVENFLAERDGLTGDDGPNNFYLYRFQNTTRFTVLPFDKSGTFWDVNDSIFRNITDGPQDRRNRLVVRALQEPDLLRLYLDTLLECADSASSVAGALPTDAPFAQGWLEREVAREYDQIRAAALADTRRDYTDDQFEQAIADLKVFARDRSVAVRAQVAATRTR